MQLLTMSSAIIHFRYFLEGGPFTIFTDHNPIVSALKKSSEPASGRQARQLAAIAEATNDIQHVSGKDNIVADSLSRPGIISQDTIEDIPDDARTNSDLQCYRTGNKIL